MGRHKKQPVAFADAFDIHCETCSETELRDTATALRIWARQRKLGFVVEIRDLPPARAGVPSRAAVGGLEEFPFFERKEDQK